MKSFLPIYSYLDDALLVEDALEHFRDLGAVLQPIPERYQKSQGGRPVGGAESFRWVLNFELSDAMIELKELLVNLLLY